MRDTVSERDIRAMNTLVRTLEKVLELERKERARRIAKRKHDKRFDDAERDAEHHQRDVVGLQDDREAVEQIADVFDHTPSQSSIGPLGSGTRNQRSNNTKVRIGTPIATAVANGYRPDVDAIFHWGTNHGFDAVIPVSVGGTVCAFGVNVGVGSRDTPLGCGNIPGPDPVGSLDSIARAPGGTHITGWGLDPDLGGAATILVTRDGEADAAVETGAITNTL